MSLIQFHGALCEDTKHSTRQTVFFTICNYIIDLIALDAAILDVVFNGASVQIKHLNFGLLTAVAELHVIDSLIQTVMGISGKLFDIVAAKRQIGLEANIACFICKRDLHETVRRNYAAIRSRNIVLRVKPEGHGADFAVHANAIDFILLHGLFCGKLKLLPVIDKARGSRCYADFLPGVGQLNELCFLIQSKALRGVCLDNAVFSEIQLAGFGNPVFIRGDLGYNGSDLCAQGAVAGVDVLICNYLIACTRQITKFIYSGIDRVDNTPGAFLIYDTFLAGDIHARKDFAGLCNGNLAFLRHVIGGDCNHAKTFQIFILGRSYGKVDGCAVENIPVWSLHLDKLVTAGTQLLRSDEVSVFAHIEGINGGQSRIGIAHGDLIAVAVIDFKPGSSKRDSVSRFGIRFHDLDIRRIRGVINQEAVSLSVFTDEHGKVLHKFRIRIACRLMNGIEAIRQLSCLGKSVFIADHAVTLRFLRVFIASCGGQINLKGRADLGCFNLRGAVIAMLDDRDISLNDLLIRDQGRGMV